MYAVEITRKLASHRATRTSYKIEIPFGYAREVIVDDHRWNGGEKAYGCREERLGGYTKVALVALEGRAAPDQIAPPSPVEKR